MTSLSLKLSAIGLALGLAAFTNAPASALPSLDPTVGAQSAGAVQIEQVKKKHMKKMMKKMKHGK